MSFLCSIFISNSNSHSISNSDSNNYNNVNTKTSSSSLVGSESDDHTRGFRALGAASHDISNALIFQKNSKWCLKFYLNRLDGKRLTETKQIYGFESEDIAKYEIARFSDFLKCGGILKEFDWHYNLNELSIKKKDLKKMIENPNLRDLFAAAAFNQSKNKNAQTPNGFSKEEKINKKNLFAAS